jgi:hypothetical protein
VKVRPQNRQNSEYRRYLKDLRRGEADTAGQVAKSQEAIEDSLAVLRRDERMMDVAQKPKTHRQHSEGHSPDRAGRKTRPNRSGA